MENKISVWIDRTSEAGKASVIVSLDSGDSSATLRSYRYSATQHTAKRYAQSEAKRRGLEAVIERPDGSGQWVTL